jgi:hypothetical protein
LELCIEVKHSRRSRMVEDRHRAQPRSRQALLLSTPQETHCGPALVQLSARAQVLGPRYAMRPPSLIHSSSGHHQRSRRIASSSLLKPLHRNPPAVVLNALSHVLPTDGATSSNPLATWLPRSGQQVPIERAACHHAATYIYQQALASAPPQTANQLH